MSTNETHNQAWNVRQTTALLVEAQQALVEARQHTNEPAVLVCLLRIEHCLLRIGLLGESSPGADAGGDPQTDGTASTGG